MATALLGVPVPLASLLGVGTAVATLVLGIRFQKRWWEEALADIEVLFPSPPAD